MARITSAFARGYGGTRQRRPPTIGVIRAMRDRLLFRKLVPISVHSWLEPAFPRRAFGKWDRGVARISAGFVRQLWFQTEKARGTLPQAW